jgi:hypothetical protein
MLMSLYTYAVFKLLIIEVLNVLASTQFGVDAPASTLPGLALDWNVLILFINKLTCNVREIIY